MSDPRSANLLGALVTALHDELEAATSEAAAHGSAFPAALVSILGEPGMSIETLRRILGVSHSGTVRLLDQLEAERLVERKAGPDGRTVALHLTAAGRRQAKAVQGARLAVLDNALGLLTAQERSQLLRLNEKLLGGLTRDRDHSDHICRLCDLAACPGSSCPVECAVEGAA
jgi:MarR family transcriptional regulator, negative regulator of the multidrug operon emrRAB